MLNILKSEFLKLKKDTMFYTGTIISVFVPILIIIKDKFLSMPPDEITAWISNCCLIDFLILSALSGFIINVNNLTQATTTYCVFLLIGTGFPVPFFIQDHYLN